MRSPRTPARKARVCGCPSSTVTSGAGWATRNSSSAMAERLLALTFDSSWTARKIFAGELRHTTPARTPRDSSRNRGRLLLNRSRRQPEVGGFAVRVGEFAQGREQRPFEVLGEGRLPAGQARD